MFIRPVNRDWELLQWVSILAAAALLTLLLTKAVGGSPLGETRSSSSVTSATLHHGLLFRARCLVSSEPATGHLSSSRIIC